MTQEELAAALFVSRTAVSKWQSGRSCPGIDSLQAASLLALMGVNPWLRAVFIALVCAAVLLGVATWMMQGISDPRWTRGRTCLSLLLSVLGLLLFILARQPYAAVLALPDPAA